MKQFIASTFHTPAEKHRITLNNLTGRSRHSSHRRPVSTDATASQLVRNERHEDFYRESSRTISQKVADLWTATKSSPDDIPGNFTSRQFTVAFNTYSQVKLLILFSRSLFYILELI